MDAVQAQVQELEEESSWEAWSLPTDETESFCSESEEGSERDSGDEVCASRIRKRATLP